MGKKVVQESRSGALVQSGVKVSPSTNKPHLGKRKATLAKTIIRNDYSSDENISDDEPHREAVNEIYKLSDKVFHEKMVEVISGENELCLSKDELPLELPQEKTRKSSKKKNKSAEEDLEVDQDSPSQDTDQDGVDKENYGSPNNKKGHAPSSKKKKRDC